MLIWETSGAQSPPHYSYDNSYDSSYTFPGDVPELRLKRLKLLAWGSGISYTASLAGLYALWYQDSMQPRFRFFNDNAEWQQVDKWGHFYSAYHLNRATTQAFRWAGMPTRKAAFWGMVTGIAAMAPIEILDGFSERYGASWGDFLVNAAGSAFFYTQLSLWNDVRIHPKFSFRQTSLAPLRPEVLGQGLREELIKDYNGQTYWLSIDLDKFIASKSRILPWFNIAVGYGAANMLYAQNLQNREISHLRHYRQFYLALDPDLSAWPTRKRWLKTLIFLIDMIHLPAPTLEFNRQRGFLFHPFY
ncbi:MAG: DUF2279 domain-containing protein [Bacteroidia bacterium]|nr:DUF2279 domain-containing protein [Bacteroidia bacterium]